MDARRASSRLGPAVNGHGRVRRRVWEPFALTLQ